ncbi:hypothetical protein B0H16DRAFT_1462628 [Mycena metata]|uniref:Uncharacterized protein n=1 Tax=Mycena metata TaxID=1033252 RepID=A0AAD7N585_9AGAR|nr:hypothetical protein B0H16DRAFT_1462628 [Mycena metata]
MHATCDGLCTPSSNNFYTNATQLEHAGGLKKDANLDIADAVDIESVRHLSHDLSGERERGAGSGQAMREAVCAKRRRVVRLYIWMAEHEEGRRAEHLTASPRELAQKLLENAEGGDLGGQELVRALLEVRGSARVGVGTARNAFLHRRSGNAKSARFAFVVWRACSPRPFWEMHVCGGLSLGLLGAGAHASASAYPNATNAWVAVSIISLARYTMERELLVRCDYSRLAFAHAGWDWSRRDAIVQGSLRPYSALLARCGRSRETWGRAACALLPAAVPPSSPLHLLLPNNISPYPPKKPFPNQGRLLRFVNAGAGAGCIEALSAKLDVPTALDSTRRLADLDKARGHHGGSTHTRPPTITHSTTASNATSPTAGAGARVTGGTGAEGGEEGEEEKEVGDGDRIKVDEQAASASHGDVRACDGVRRGRRLEATDRRSARGSGSGRKSSALAGDGYHQAGGQGRAKLAPGADARYSASLAHDVDTAVAVQRGHSHHLHLDVPPPSHPPQNNEDLTFTSATSEAEYHTTNSSSPAWISGGTQSRARRCSAARSTAPIRRLSLLAEVGAGCGGDVARAIQRSRAGVGARLLGVFGASANGTRTTSTVAPHAEREHGRSTPDRAGKHRRESVSYQCQLRRDEFTVMDARSTPPLSQCDLHVEFAAAADAPPDAEVVCVFGFARAWTWVAS